MRKSASTRANRGTAMHRILVVDDEQAIRTMLQDFFEDTYAITTAASGAEALALLDREDFDMVISDINMPGLKGPELLWMIKERKPGIKTMLMTAYNVDDYIRMAKEYNISNIIPKTVPFNYDEVGALVDGILTERVFGLERYLLPEGVVENEYRITSSDDGTRVREELASIITEKFGSVTDIKLIMDEIITNAIYHAPVGKDGAPKYREYAPVRLEESEHVFVKWGHDAEKYGISIVDNQGRLSMETVLYKIDRHTRGEGMLDDSGRGIHMSRLFADRMIINIKAGVKTEVIIMNYFSHTYRGYRPLYINEL
ncbi:MAG: response regulator [Chitinivibrionales bacterium]|nr:response regulator [Chitinivibrionales bacterium]MBD3395193.1 response regulator [Chitinivibrionales bacterium]